MSNRLIFEWLMPLVAMLAVCFLNDVVLGQEPKVEFSALTGRRSSLLEKSKEHFLYSVNGLEDSRPLVHWSLVANQRILSHGKSNLIVAEGADILTFMVDLSTPPLGEGVVLAAELQVTCTLDEKTYQHSRPLFIFSRNPFPAQQSFFEHAQIKLFDTEGKTAELLEENEIPHTRLLNLAAMDLVSEGIVLVGEGISFRKQRMLPESLMRAASRGVSVLCLAPSEGNFPLSVVDRGQQIRPTRLVLEREDFVHRYDKRFDTVPIGSPLSLTPRQNGFEIGYGNGPDFWSLLSLDFPVHKSSARSGKLIVCGLEIVARWDSSPVPRYLFTHILQELTKNSSTEEE